jgi:NADPH:quinone reductase-like Zn-dependent oxidoreductase
VKAIQFSAFGIPHEVANCVEIAEPEAPGPDEVVYAVESFPINPADLLLMSGNYSTLPQLPAVPGAECVGRVTAVGDRVDHLSAGDRVIPICRENWAEKRKAKSHELVKVSVEVDPLQLAMLSVNPASALLMLRSFVTLQPGDWVIQDAANSGVGRCVIALAKANGIRTVNVVRRQSLIADLKALGADVVVLDGDDLGERVRAATDDAEIKLALHAVAGELCGRLAGCLADGGIIANYGLQSGAPMVIRSEDVLYRNITLTGFARPRYLSRMTYDELTSMYDELAQRVASGELEVPITAVYGIDEIKKALEHAEREARSGKVLVRVQEPLT